MRPITAAPSNCMNAPSENGRHPTSGRRLAIRFDYAPGNVRVNNAAVRDRPETG